MLIGKFFSFQLLGSEGAKCPRCQSGGAEILMIAAKMEVIRDIGQLTFGVAKFQSAPGTDN